MEDPVLSRCTILGAILNHLNFGEASYICEVSGNVCRYKVLFELHNDPDEANSENIHTIYGNWFRCAEESCESAAAHAIAHLQKNIRFRVHDYSQSVLTNLSQQNYQLSANCLDMAKIIDNLLLNWIVMSKEMDRAGESCESQIIYYGCQTISPNNRSAIDPLLHRIGEVGKQLCRSHKENMKLIHDMRRPINDLLHEFLLLDKTTKQSNAAEPMAAVVPIPATIMLNQILSSFEMPLAEYQHATRTDGSVIR